MNPGVVTIIMLGAMFLLMVTGVPVAFALGGIAVVLSIVLFGFDSTYVLVSTAFDQWTGQTLLAIPLFLFMAEVLSRSGIGEDAYDMFYKWMGRLRGGLLIGTIIICTIFAAMTGTSGAATLSMGIIALPSMLNRKYDKRMVTGGIMAGGLLGPIIPPSIIMVIYSVLARESVGSMFMAGVIPGCMLSAAFCIAVVIRSWLNPALAPALPADEKPTRAEKWRSLKALILPFLIIILVLGSIYTGMATPTEAAGVGAFGALLSAFVHRRLNWKNVMNPALKSTLILCGLCFWVLLGATCYSHIYVAAGARVYITNMVKHLNVDPFTVIILMQISLFFLGMIMDDYAIVMLLTPIYVPIIKALGFDGIWFGLLFMVNMQVACLTPPYGFSLFYMRGLIPQIRDRIPVDISMGDIWVAAWQYIPLQCLVLALIMKFPQVVLWLPNLMMKRP